MDTFKVLIGCETKDDRFEPGDTVTEDDFSPKVIENWVKIGVLKAPRGWTPVSNRRKKKDGEDGREE